MRWSLSFLLLGLVAAVHALSSSGNRLVVVLEEAAEKATYSSFWGDLEARGYALSFESPKNSKFSLFEHGEKAYDHLLILPPKSKGFGPALNPKNIIEFMNKDGNVLLALSGKSTTPSAISSLLIELDLHLSNDRSSIAIDHFNYDTISASDKHDVLLLQRPGQLRPDTKAFFDGEGLLAFPRAVPQTLGDSNNLVSPILRAPVTAYSYNPKEDEPPAPEEVTATGSQLALVSAMQARNSARFTVLGSVESLEDKWFEGSVKAPGGKESKTVNRAFAEQVSSWAFQETGVLKVGKVEHYLAGDEDVPEALNPSLYRIKNETVFNIEISEYAHDKYIPFEVPSNDSLQLEFTMLSPFHRLNLQPTHRTKNSTVYTARFTIPDQHGIFSFRVNYKRPFLTNIEEKHEVTIRHYAHDEYLRSWKISGGWVWIGGLWSVIGGFLVFVVVWLYAEPVSAAAKDKKTQ